MLARFRVTGHSMEPHFHEGDYIIVRKFGTPRVGDVVVVDYSGRKMLKRVLEIENNRYVLRGDNQHDSKNYAVSRKQIIGKLLWHIRR